MDCFPVRLYIFHTYFGGSQLFKMAIHLSHGPFKLEIEIVLIFKAPFSFAYNI